MTTIEAPTTDEPAVDHSAALAADMLAMKAGMDDLLAWSQAHPDIRLFRSSDSWGIASSCELSTVEIVRAIKDGAPLGAVRKSTTDVDGVAKFWVRRSFAGGVDLFHIAERDEVCTARVVGVEAVQVPDPDAPLVTVVRDVVEWDCEPVLAEAVAS